MLVSEMGNSEEAFYAFLSKRRQCYWLKLKSYKNQESETYVPETAGTAPQTFRETTLEFAVYF